MHIVLLGSRGIPNRYGGFEQFTERLSVRLTNRGHQVWVFVTESHPYKKTSFQGVHLIHIKEPLKKFGPIYSLFYDLHCLKRAYDLIPDVVLMCGYGSAGFLRFVKNPLNIPVLIHMDGMEWKRKKWNLISRMFLRWSEKEATSRAREIITDSKAIRNYYLQKYGRKSFFVPYGASIPEEINTKWNDHLELRDLLKKQFLLVIARMEPENNIEMIIEGYLASNTLDTLVMVGNHQTRYGKRLKKKYGKYSLLKFAGAIYEKAILDALRSKCKMYIHGHSVGGTNPSLLEAMASSCFVLAHDNKYNREVLKENALYFSTIDEIRKQIKDFESLFNKKPGFIRNNLNRIKKEFTWEKVTDAYLEVFNKNLRTD